MAASRWKSLGPCALIAAAGAAVYLNSLTCPFVFDDFNAIINNTHVRSLRPLWQALSAPHQSSVAGRPVVALSLAFNYALGGLDVRGYHAANILIHVAAALLLFGIVRRTFSMEPVATRYGGSASNLALVTALVWVVHPLQTEAVTYTVQRSESLMALFYLASFYAFIRSATAFRPALWGLAAIICSALAMACKEVAITLPIVMVLYDRIFISGSFRRALAARPCFYAGLAATWLVLAGLMVGGPRSQTAGFGIEATTSIAYALTQPAVILHYVFLTLWPSSLCIDYGWRTARTMSEIVPPVILLVVLLAVTAWATVRRPRLGFLPACFFIILSPTSSVVPIQDLAFEHRMYLPLAALCPLYVIAVHYMIGRLSRAGPLRFFRGEVLTAIIVVLLGARTVLRNRDYASTESIWRDAVIKRPDNPRAYHNLGVALTRAGDERAAIRFHQKAVQLYPRYFDALYDLAMALTRTGRCDLAIPPAREAVRVDPKNAKARDLLGVTLTNEGDLAGGSQQFQEASGLDPAFAEAHFHLARVYETQGRLEEAEKRFRLALAARADYPEACKQLMALLVRAGRGTEEASPCASMSARTIGAGPAEQVKR